MPIESIITFWGISFLLVWTPGMDWAYTISAGMRNRMVAPAVSGILIGYLLITAIIAVGVGAFVSRNQIVMTAITVLGSFYLIFVGINMIMRPSVPCAGEARGQDSWARWTINGIGVSGLNPKGLLLFLALLPQFTDTASSWPVPIQIIMLGLVHTISCGVVYLLVGYCSKAVLHARPRAARLVSRFSGVAMTLAAIYLFMEQVVL